MIGQQAAIVNRRKLAAAAAKASTNQTKRRVFAVGEPDAEPAAAEEHAEEIAEMGYQWPVLVFAFNNSTVSYQLAMCNVSCCLMPCFTIRVLLCVLLFYIMSGT